MWSIVRRHPVTQRPYAEAGRHTIRRDVIAVVRVVVVGVAVVVRVPSVVRVGTVRRPQPPVGSNSNLAYNLRYDES